MIDNQLVGRYQRLCSELDVARSRGGVPGRAGRIDRLLGELAAIERTLAVQRLGARLIKLDDDRPEPGAATRLAPA